jgi:hypothetical protein
MAPIDRARCFAALSGPFDPVEAFAPRAERKSEDVAVVASQLAAMCEPTPGAEGKWLMRTSERRDVLKMLHDEYARRLHRRPCGAADAETEDLLDAILGNGLFAPADIEQAVASLESRGLIERIVVAVDRAGEIAPAYPLLQRARSALGLLDRRDRWEKLKAHGVYGRDDQRRVIDMAEATDREGAGRRCSSWPAESANRCCSTIWCARRSTASTHYWSDSFRSRRTRRLDQPALTMEVARQVAIDRRAWAGTAEEAPRGGSMPGPDGPGLKNRLPVDAGRRNQPRPAIVHSRFCSTRWRCCAIAARPIRKPCSCGSSGWSSRGSSRCACSPPAAASRSTAFRSGSARRSTSRAWPIRRPTPCSSSLACLPRFEVRYRRSPTAIRSFSASAPSSRARPSRGVPGEEAEEELASAFLYRILLSRLNDKALLLVADPG